MKQINQTDCFGFVRVIFVDDAYDIYTYTEVTFTVLYMYIVDSLSHSTVFISEDSSTCFKCLTIQNHITDPLVSSKKSFHSSVLH